MADLQDRDNYQDNVEVEEEGGGASEPEGGARRGGRGLAGRGRFPRRPRVCAFCAEHARAIDYKQVETLSRYVTERGQLRPRRKTGTCARHQRAISVAVKRARHMALLPFTGEQVRLGSRRG